MRFKFYYPAIMILSNLFYPLSLMARESQSDEINRDDINSYIYNLEYIEEQLLATTLEGTTTSLPPREEGSGKVIICQSKNKSLSQDIESFVTLSPASGMVYPGALINVDRNLANGIPSGITLQRAPIVISVDLPGLEEEGYQEVQNPNVANVRSTVQSLVNKWFEISGPDSYINAARMSYVSKKAYSESQLNLALGMNSSWSKTASIESAMNTSSSNKQSVGVAMFKQVFYTATVNPKQSPAHYFDPSVQLEDAKA